MQSSADFITITFGFRFSVHTGPALGSWLAAALVVIFSLPFLLYRAITEDRILQVELAGYSDYAARVRWRLLPGMVRAKPRLASVLRRSTILTDALLF
jgi:protein-S-isoprenylcysteine O-methyltransferase Ste14